VSVDKFHLVKLGNEMLTRVRQRLARAHHGRRGRSQDPAWAHRMLLLRGANTLAQAWQERMRLGYFVHLSGLPEAVRLYDTIEAWWEAIEVLIVTGATTARVEAANTGIKNIKRTGRGFRNAENYRTRILLSSAARTAA
ncbi:MAG: transposase, partial [Micrococcus sp.]|nr:transposase [Micrococcus sp.]